MSTNKALVLIDGANMFYTQQDMGWTLDWKKVTVYLKNKWDVGDVRYYTGIKDNDVKMQKYLKYLGYIGIKVASKPLKQIKDRVGNLLMYKSNFDVEMAVDAMLKMKKYDVLVLFSGDSDFDYLVKILKIFSKDVWVFSTRAMISWELKLSANYIFLEDIKNQITR